MTSLSIRASPPRIDIVVIGCSTGGPDVLARVLPEIPASFPIPILIAQHMSGEFTKQLAQHLNHLCALSVQEGGRGVTLDGGGIWIAPGGYHLEVRKTANKAMLFTTTKPPVHSCRPAADVLFHSAVGVFKNRVLGLVLTGMGSDGLSGSVAILKAGGEVYAQDKESSIVWGMPGAVVEAGLASRVLAPDAMARAINDRAMSHRTLAISF